MNRFRAAACVALLLCSVSEFAQKDPLTELGQLPDAIASQSRALGLDPTMPYLPGYLLQARMAACDWVSFADDCRDVGAGIVRGERVIVPFAALMLPLTAALGIASGMVAGLATITPASGFVTVGSAILIGFTGGAVCYLAVAKLKARFGYDDSLDAFGVHGIGSTVGMLLLGLLASPSANPLIATTFQRDGRTVSLETHLVDSLAALKARAENRDYNRADFLGRVIDSVRARKFRPTQDISARLANMNAVAGIASELLQRVTDLVGSGAFF